MEISTVSYITENGYVYRVETFQSGKVLKIKLGHAKDAVRLVGGCY